MVCCTTIPDLRVIYRLPLQSGELQGKKVFLEFEDARSTKEVLGRGARGEFKSFSGNLTFSVARGDEPGLKIGAYDIPSLFEEVFRRRLENMGAEALPVRRQSEFRLVIALEDFLLDLVGRKWVVTMAYEARLMKNDRVLGSRQISGEAERLKLIGRKQAHIVMGEFFTDMVNKLDLVKMFAQGGL